MEGTGSRSESHLHSESSRNNFSDENDGTISGHQDLHKNSERTMAHSDSVDYASHSNNFSGQNMETSELQANNSHSQRSDFSDKRESQVDSSHTESKRNISKGTDPQTRMFKMAFEGIRNQNIVRKNSDKKHELKVDSASSADSSAERNSHRNISKTVEQQTSSDYGSWESNISDQMFHPQRHVNNDDMWGSIDQPIDDSWEDCVSNQKLKSQISSLSNSSDNYSSRESNASRKTEQQKSRSDYDSRGSDKPNQKHSAMDSSSSYKPYRNKFSQRTEPKRSIDDDSQRSGDSDQKHYTTDSGNNSRRNNFSRTETQKPVDDDSWGSYDQPLDGDSWGSDGSNQKHEPVTNSSFSDSNDYNSHRSNFSKRTEPHKSTYCRGSDFSNQKYDTRDNSASHSRDADYNSQRNFSNRTERQRSVDYDSRGSNKPRINSRSFSDSGNNYNSHKSYVSRRNEHQKSNDYDSWGSACSESQNADFSSRQNNFSKRTEPQKSIGCDSWKSDISDRKHLATGSSTNYNSNWSNAATKIEPQRSLNDDSKGSDISSQRHTPQVNSPISNSIDHSPSTKVFPNGTEAQNSVDDGSWGSYDQPFDGDSWGTDASNQKQPEANSLDSNDYNSHRCNYSKKTEPQKSPDCNSQGNDFSNQKYQPQDNSVSHSKNTAYNLQSNVSYRAERQRFADYDSHRGNFNNQRNKPQINSHSFPDNGNNYNSQRSNCSRKNEHQRSNDCDSRGPAHSESRHADFNSHRNNVSTRTGSQKVVDCDKWGSNTDRKDSRNNFNSQRSNFSKITEPQKSVDDDDGSWGSYAQSFGGDSWEIDASDQIPQSSNSDSCKNYNSPGSKFSMRAEPKKSDSNSWESESSNQKHEPLANSFSQSESRDTGNSHKNNTDKKPVPEKFTDWFTWACCSDQNHESLVDISSFSDPKRTESKNSFNSKSRGRGIRRPEDRVDSPLQSKSSTFNSEKPRQRIARSISHTSYSESSGYKSQTEDDYSTCSDDIRGEELILSSDNNISVNFKQSGQQKSICKFTPPQNEDDVLICSGELNKKEVSVSIDGKFQGTIHRSMEEKVDQCEVTQLQHVFSCDMTLNPSIPPPKLRDLTSEEAPPMGKEHISAITQILKRLERDRPKSTRHDGLRDEIKTIITTQFPGERVLPCGSYRSGLATHSSDINLEWYTGGKIKKIKMKEVKELLEEELPDFEVLLEEEPHRKEPTIYVLNEENGIHCEIAYLGSNCSYNDNCATLRKVFNSDNKATILAIGLKTWAQKCNIHEVSSGRLHPICFPFMVVHFLQHMRIMPMMNSTNHSIDLPGKRDNRPVGELWLLMLKYYAEEFNWDLNAISLMKHPLLKAEKNWVMYSIAIEDPFQPKRNLACTVNKESHAHYIKSLFQKTYKYFSNPVEDECLSDSETSEKEYETEKNSNYLLHSIPRKFDYQFNEFHFSPQIYLSSGTDDEETDDDDEEPCFELPFVRNRKKKFNRNEVTVKPLEELPGKFLRHVKTALVNIDRKHSTNEADGEKRIGFIKFLEDYIRRKFKNATLSLFGSSVNGFAFKDSDLDICMTFAGTNESEVHAPNILRPLCSHLRRNVTFKDVFFVDGAEVPLVKFHHTVTNFKGDISLYNALAIQNSKLLFQYSKMDERCRILGIAMKCLARHANIANSQLRTLSSYSYVMMVIHYLQQLDPPVLPILDKSGPKKMPQNNMSLEELWIGLLDFYSRVDREYVISITEKGHQLHGSTLQVHSRLYNIKDPLLPEKNLGHIVSEKMAEVTFKVILCARKHFTTNFEQLPHCYKNPEDYFFSPSNLTATYMTKTNCFCMNNSQKLHSFQMK